VGTSTFINRKWLFKSLNLIKGRELFMDLVKLANKKAWRVYLLGGREAVAQKTAEVLTHNLRKIKIKYNSGPELNENGNPVNESNIKIEKDIVEEINEFKPHLLFVAFGPGKQEKWLYKWLPSLKFGAGMVVGGTFDYVSGKAKLPPSWMANYGLEWVWRLITQPFYYPKRVKRVVMAFPVFPLKVFWHKFNLK
jgi:N-acetylglucosaminyldiphosphoundecaprenol N-acetyl-beta-D-mannosaminyltransferase